MSQPPPPPYQPYQPPSPYGQPKRSSNRTLWIVLGVIGGLLLLCCGGGVVALGIFANEVDNVIEEENRNNRPTEVGVGEAFEHDEYRADGGWEVASEELAATFTITGLTLTNGGDTDRSAQLTFTVYEGDRLVGEILCTTPALAPDEAAEADCYSADDFAPGFDEVRVADSY